MVREALLQAIEHGLVRVTMNGGSSYDIDGLRDVAAWQLTARLATLCSGELMAVIVLGRPRTFD